MNLKSVPRELAELDQWVCWRYEPSPGRPKPAKIPYCPATGRKAKANDPRTWASLEDAYNAALGSALSDAEYDGLGFCFSDHDPYVGVDVDEGCPPKLRERIIAVLDGGYMEVSPGGKGLHIIVRGSIPASGKNHRTLHVEMYQSLHYFTWSGKSLDTVGGIPDRSEALQKIFGYLFPEPKPTTTVKSTGPALAEDAELIGRMMRNATLNDLWNGQWESHYDSQSVADMRLAGGLAHFTGGDLLRMARLFPQSGLMREKWNKIHHSDGSTYGQKTLQVALGNYSG